MNIVILGGGTAGWLTAAMITARHPAHKITVIESSKIGIIGVGESTTGFFTETLLNDLKTLDVDHNEFIVETGATLKFGIKHKGWTADIDSHYFGVLEGSYTTTSVPDVMFAYAATQRPESVISSTHTGYLLENNKSNFGPNMQFAKYGHAFHIDANLTGKYFAKKCLARPNVKLIDSEVIDVVLSEEGIQSLTLSNGNIVTADLFIDCSGMSRVLINKLDPDWVSYKKHLPLDSAMPFQTKYQEGEYPTPYTTAWAQKHGWMWQTPLMDRQGNGYVFDSSFITADQAQEEIETILGQQINPVKVLKFDPGRKPNAWVKNCVAVGLSNSFLEPLEATSIHTTIAQIRMLTYEFIRPLKEETLCDGSIKLFNKRVAKHFDDIRDYLVLHYMGGRNDSEFWKYISSGATKTDFVHELLETAKCRLPTYNDFPRYSGALGWELYCYILFGIGALNLNAVQKEFNSEMFAYADVNFKRYLNHLENEYRDYVSYDKFIDHFRNIRLEKNIRN